VAKPGPKPIWTDAIADHIITQMMEHGRSLRSICQADDGMPNMMTVLRELDRNPEFVARYARARETMADHAAEDAMAIARASTPETAASDRVKLIAHQWYASKLRPRVYGVDSKTTITGPGDGPIQIAAVTLDASELDEDQRAVMRAALLAAAAPR